MTSATYVQNMNLMASIFYYILRVEEDEEGAQDEVWTDKNGYR